MARTSAFNPSLHQLHLFCYFKCMKYITPLFSLVVTRILLGKIISTCKNIRLTLQKMMCKSKNLKAMFKTSDRTSFTVSNH